MLCNASPEPSLLQPACFGLSASSSILFPGLSLAWRCSGLNSGSRFMVILSFLVPRGCSVLGFQILHRMMSDGSSFCCPLEKFVSPKLTTDFEAGEGWCLSDCRTPSIFQQNYLVYLVDEVSASPHPCGRPSGCGSSQLYPILTPPLSAAVFRAFVTFHSSSLFSVLNRVSSSTLLAVLSNTWRRLLIHSLI